MTNQAQQSSKKVQIILDDKGGWSRGGRIANAANYRRTRYDITIDGKQAGFMKEDYDGVTAHKRMGCTPLRSPDDPNQHS